MTLSRESWINLVLVLILLAIPYAALQFGNPFYVTLATRMAILGLAAVGLNIALIPTLGLWGAALATALAMTLEAVMLGLLVWRRLDIVMLIDNPFKKAGATP